jgi:hypothetical protein
MILPAFGTVLSPFFIAYTIVQTLMAVVPAFSLIGIGLKAFLIAELVVNLALVAGWIYAVVLLFQKKRSYPWLFNMMMLTTLAVTIMDAAVGFAIFDIPPDRDGLKDMVRGAIGCAIWIPYMLKSRRVRNTFVN